MDLNLSAKSSNTQRERGREGRIKNKTKLNLNFFL